MKRLVLGFSTAVFVAVLLFVVFVWPTRYRYERVKFGQMETVAKFDRLSWNVWLFYPSTGWKQISLDKQRMPTPPPSFELEEAAKGQ
jgi:hypothetical protein